MDATLDALMLGVREALASSPHLGGEAPERVETLGDELRPFVEAAARCADVPTGDPRWSEARSLALLFAYRLGDQSYAPGVVAGALLAWREAAPSGGAAVLDGLWPLLLDGYARGREDRARAAIHARCAETAPVLELAPRRWLVTGVGALDADGAREVVARAASRLLRGDAEAVMLDLTGVPVSEAPLLAELLGLERDARSLGVRPVIAMSEAAAAAVEPLGWSPTAPTEVHRAPEAALRSLLWSGDRVRAAVGWVMQRAGR